MQSGAFVGGDGIGEGEHIGAGTRIISKRTPCSVEDGRTNNGNNFVESHGDVGYIALGMGAGIYDGVAETGGSNGIAESHTDEEVLVAPSVIVVAAGIEARGDIIDSGAEEDTTRSAVAALELLLPELASGKTELVSSSAAVREVGLALSVATVGKLEADLVDRVRRVVDRPFGVVSCVVAGAAVTGDNLNILVAVVLLLLGETDGGIYLIAQRVEVAGGGVGAVDKAAGADGGGLLRVVVAVVDEYISIEGAAGLHLTGGRRVTDIEVLAAVHARGVVAIAVKIDEVGDALAHLISAELCEATGNGAVSVCQLKATLVEHLEAIGARSAGLVLVGIRIRGSLGDVDNLGAIAHGKGDGVTPLGEVLPRNGRETYRAVVDRLLGGGHVALDGEGAALVGNLEDRLDTLNPLGGILAVAYRTAVDGNLLSGPWQVGANPAEEGIALARRSVEGERLGLNIISRGIRGDESGVVNVVVSELVSDGGKYRGDDAVVASRGDSVAGDTTREV